MHKGDTRSSNQNRKSEIRTCIYSQLIFNKGAKIIEWEKIVFSTNNARTTGHPHAKECFGTRSFHGKQEVTQNIS